MNVIWNICPLNGITGIKSSARKSHIFINYFVICYEQNILLPDFGNVINSLLLSCPLAILVWFPTERPKEPASRMVPLVVAQETVVLVSAWFKVLCLNKGSWKTPSTQFRRLVTGESCRLSITHTGVDTAEEEEEDEDEDGEATPWCFNMHDGYSVWFKEVAVWARDHILGLESSNCWLCCWKHSLDSQPLCLTLIKSWSHSSTTLFRQFLALSISWSTEETASGIFRITSLQWSVAQSLVRIWCPCWDWWWNGCFNSHSELSDSIVSKSSRSLRSRSLSSLPVVSSVKKVQGEGGN